MLEKRTLLVIFLKTLQVVGNIQEVLVRTGDTIVLNCTCISQINGNWVGPNRSSSETDRQEEEKLIPYTEGFNVNTKLNIPNINVVGSYENKTCNLMIKEFSIDDEGIYKCHYVENYKTNNHVYKVLLKNPPDVSIDTTESQNKITLKCQASSDPGTYEFAKWEHLSHFGKHIRYIGNTQNGTLVLEKNNYQNSGIYKCRVKIGVSDMTGEIYQKELVVDYKGPPVLVSNNSFTWFAQYPEDAKIILKVFSSSKITSGRILKIEEGQKEEEKQAFESIRSFIQSTCRESLAFYNVNFLVECIELTFKIAMPGSNDLRNYTVEVCNTYNCSSFEVSVVSAKFIEIRHSSGWIIRAIMVILAVISCALVFAVVKVRGIRKRSHDIRTSEIEMDIHGESVDNRLYLSTESRPSHSTRHQTELNDENIPTTGLNQSISALSNHYQEEISEEQNVLDDNRIIPTQHAKSNLNYAEVEFEAGPTSSTSIIHGHEDRTIYSEIDLLRLTNAIPSSSDSDEDDFVCVDGIENYNKKD